MVKKRLMQAYVNTRKLNTVIDFSKKGNIQLRPEMFRGCDNLTLVYVSQVQYNALPSSMHVWAAQSYVEIKVLEAPASLLEISGGHNTDLPALKKQLAKYYEENKDEYKRLGLGRF